MTMTWFEITPYTLMQLFWLAVVLIVLFLVAYATYGPKRAVVRHGA